MHALSGMKNQLHCSQRSYMVPCCSFNPKQGLFSTAFSRRACSVLAFKAPKAKSPAVLEFMSVKYNKRNQFNGGLFTDEDYLF